MNQPLPPIQLDVISLTDGQHRYQTLAITLTHPQDPINPVDIARVQLPTRLDLDQGVILFGKGPAWLYGRLNALCKTAPWIAVYDIRFNLCIVTHSRLSTIAIGDSLTPIFNQTPCPAILIGGPPNSGKSVLSYTLEQQLICHTPERRLFLHRANWDGEGNWTYEMSDPARAKQLVRDGERRIHEDPKTRSLIPSYFQDHADKVKRMRSLTDLLLVDVGGKPQPEKKPLLEQCTHYIIISRTPEDVEEWHQFCQPHLKPIAVIHSVLDPTLTILNTEPLLEIIAGPWLNKRSASIPPCLIDALAKHGI